MSPSFSTEDVQPALVAVNAASGAAIFALSDNGNALAVLADGAGAAVYGYTAAEGGAAATFNGAVEVDDGDVGVNGDVTIGGTLTVGDASVTELVAELEARWNTLESTVTLIQDSTQTVMAAAIERFGGCAHDQYGRHDGPQRPRTSTGWGSQLAGPDRIISPTRGPSWVARAVGVARTSRPTWSNERTTRPHRLSG